MTIRGRFRTDRFSLMLPALGLLVATCLPPAVSAQSLVVGWIESAAAVSGASAGPPVAATVVITRQGNHVTYNDQNGLQACDRLRLTDPGLVVRIMLTNKLRMRLDAQTPELQIPCNQSGVTTQLAAFLRGTLGAAESRRANAIATSSRTGSRARPPSVPALVGERSQIAAGERALFVAWKGNVAPYSIQIRRHADDTVLASVQGIAGHSTRLPRARFATGRHVLIITDGAGKTMRDEELYVVAGSTLPPLPRELAEAAIPDNTRLLYYADYLVAFKDGRFTLEALQQAAAVSPAARDWLAAWGDPD